MCKQAAIVVLGDIGRSPRMCNHALSLANQANMEVNIIGYNESKPREELVNHERIKIRGIKPFPQTSRRYFLIVAPFKVLYQIFQLLFTLFISIPSPDIILVQNPPSIPVLACVWIAKILLLFKLKRTKVIIDWHNFGYTILQISFSSSHPIVIISRIYEKLFSRVGDAHFCVTKAMQEFLLQQWGIQATVLYDQPPEYFHRSSTKETHQLFQAIQENLKLNNHSLKALDEPDLSEYNISPAYSLREFNLQTFSTTDRENGNIQYHIRNDRPVIIISSTSWTPDEDFSILLDAVHQVDQEILANPLPNFPEILLVITGKGPQKEFYEEKISKMNFHKTTIRTVWLTAEQYPVLLGSSDLGVCLHTSSSGLDLPMKVVDMFGCKLPVCAVNFQALPELVHHNENGYVFDSTQQLKQQILELFSEYPNMNTLQKMRENINLTSWAIFWEETALPLIRQLL